MARFEQTLERAPGLAYDLSVSVVCKAFKRDCIDSILTKLDRQGKRNRDLPGYMLIYYVITMGLFQSVNLKEVLRCLLEGLRSVYGGEAIKVTSKSGISQGRTRLGSEPLKQLYKETVGPIATSQTVGAYFHSWLLVSLDGSVLDLPDEAAIRTGFPKRRVKNGGLSPFPQLQFVTLMENGTHVLFGAAHGSSEVGEATLAKEVVPYLKPGMLCLADRLFYSYSLWCQAADTGADLLWRMRSNVTLEVEERLKDGSFLSRIYYRPGPKKKERSRVVRVIHYKIEGHDTPIQVMTTILDPRKASAEELAGLYGDRWEIEGAFDEIKAHLRGSRMNLRSKTPDLVVQEFYGLLLAHYAVRLAMREAAEMNHIDPDKLSYTHAVNVFKRKIRIVRSISP